MKRVLVLAYGVANYVLFLGVFVYSIGFVGGFLTPTNLDGATDGRQSRGLARSVFINLVLVGVFGVQHSVMARPAIKRWFAGWIPESIERSTYMLATNSALVVLFWQWQPIDGIVWNVSHSMLRSGIWGLFALGWLTVLVTTFLINHFDLFGLRQVWLSFRGRPYSHLPFVTPGPYRFVRHPLYVGWLLAFWATPTMTIGHLAFAMAMTVYILIAIRFEERDLTAAHAGYADYRRRVPMLVPQLTKVATDTIPIAQATGNRVPGSASRTGTMAATVVARKLS